MSKKKTNLRKKNPVAADMWAYDLNDPSLSPDTISFGSDKKVYFRCLENKNHVFLKKVSKMTSSRDGHNTGCIYCGPNAKIAFPGETDLITVCPKAKNMWDFERNINLDPKQILPKSNKSAYFKCENGHSILRVIQNFQNHRIVWSVKRKEHSW